jgi:capsular exopolysaccharide synthesis family protein
MELNQYLSIVKRWSWLLILGMTLGAMLGFGVSLLQTPVYEANTRIIVSRSTLQADSNNFIFISDQQVTKTYIELLNTSSVYDAASQKLGYRVYPDQVRAQQVTDTRIIRITIEDADPQHAADIANAMVEALIRQNELLETGRYTASDASLQLQIEQVEAQINAYQKNLDNLSTETVNEQVRQVETLMKPLQEEMTQVQQEIAILTPAYSAERKEKIVELQARLGQIQPLFQLYQEIYTNLVVLGNSGGIGLNDTATVERLQSTLELYQQIYLNLINTREAIRLARLQNTQSLAQIDAASVPTAPVRPQPLNNTMLSGMIGLMIAASIVFLIEYMNDTVRTPEEIQHVFGIPLVGFIAEIQSFGKGEADVYVKRQPRSPVSEAFRSLRTNLEFSAIDKPLKTILVTGAEVGDGKTTVAVNLASIIAQGGKKVLLLDADLRRPRVHRYLGMHNKAGLTDLFRETHRIEEIKHDFEQSSSSSMSVISSGSLPPNPAELLGSRKMEAILKDLAGAVDIVVIDSPPAMVADAQILAAKVDGVLLVMTPGRTHLGAIRSLHEQMTTAGAHILGFVFNRIQRNSEYYYRGYSYYSPERPQNSHYLRGDDLDVEATDHRQGARAPLHSILNKFNKLRGRAD